MRDVWVQGRQYGVTRPPQIDPRGTWLITSEDQGTFKEATLRLDGPLNRIRGTIEMGSRRAVPLTNVRIIAETGRIEASFPGEPLGQEGAMLLAGSVQDSAFFGWLSLPNGTDARYKGTRTEAFVGATRGVVASKVPKIDLPFLRPSMEFGRAAPPVQPAAVLVKNATVWTQGPQGRMEKADLLVQGGKIAKVGIGLTAPANAVVIDGTGKQVTPGLIDPHTHSGVSSVNESGFAIVPEVQMGDVITHNNIWFYRQLAGGTYHHDDSARLRESDWWRERVCEDQVGLIAGRLQDDRRSPHREICTRRKSEAQPDALSEHARGCAGNHPPIISWPRAITRRNGNVGKKEKTGIPPRKDLRMEAILDILNQKLLVTSHGYRADDFLALVRLAEEFGFRIQALQHGVEAYKIAGELKKSGVACKLCGVTGARFKLEAYDATSYNAKILMEAGVVTSLHSDDAEISTRMNWEAGKLLRSGVNEIDAMSTVTINAAKAIAIDNRVGSLEAGKDADFVIWNGNPLSQFTKAEQTWVEGRKYFSIDEDKVLREEVARQRAAQLIQAVIAAAPDNAPAGGAQAVVVDAVAGLEQRLRQRCPPTTGRTGAGAGARK